RGGRVPDGAPRSQPISMPTHLTHALGVAVRLVLEEGLEQRFRRHAVAARAFRAGIDAMRLQMFPDASILSDTVSCVKTPPGIEPAAVVKLMRQTFGILIGTGLDQTRATTLRIGHMGITASPLYILPTLSALEMTLRKLGSVWGTGTDNIDLNAAGMRGVTVCNTPGVNAFAVAEHALTLMLAVGRKITTLDAEMRKNKWPRELLTQLHGKTLGVFGMGT